MVQSRLFIQMKKTIKITSPDSFPVTCCGTVRFLADRICRTNTNGPSGNIIPWVVFKGIGAKNFLSILISSMVQEICLKRSRPAGNVSKNPLHQYKVEPLSGFCTNFRHVSGYCEAECFMDGDRSFVTRFNTGNKNMDMVLFGMCD